MERRHNDLQEVAATVGYTNTKFDHLKMTAGLEAKFSEGIHYKTIDDLLGGIQWIDVDAFAERDIKDLAVNIGMTQDEIGKVMQNDLADPDRKVKEGDRFGYDYRMNMSNLKFWFQNEWRFNEVDFYYAIQGTFSSMQRSTDMVNGRAWYLSQIPDADASLYFGKVNVTTVRSTTSLTHRSRQVLRTRLTVVTT